MTEIRLENIRKAYGNVEVIHGIDLQVDSSDFVVFVGPSGCGKSTLLRIIAGLEDITTGILRIDGQVVNSVTTAERGLSMVFQPYALYPHMSVYKNMAFGLENAKMPRAQIDAKVRAAAAMLRITDYLDRKPKSLSGGQRQRVAIGRAIERDPKAFLFDEPLSNLDAELQVTMRKELAALHARIGATMIYVTHDQTEAMTLVDRIVALRGGRIEQAGKPLELFNTPQNLFLAGFIGSPRMGLVAADVQSGELGPRLCTGSTTVSLPSLVPVRPGDRVTYGFRPEHVTLVEHSVGDIAATVDLAERMGGETYRYCSDEGIDQITLRQHGQLPTTLGQKLGLRLDRSRMHLFDADGKVIVNGLADA